MSIPLMAKLFCLVFGVVYKVIAWLKKERADQQHYHLMSEIYVVGLVIAILITDVNSSECKTKEVKTDTITILNKKK